MDLQSTVVVFIAGGILLIGAFAGRARREGADKAFYHLLYIASALVLGVIVALTYLGGWW